VKRGVIKYWPKTKPTPEGWRLVDDLSGTHHGFYSVLIEKIEDHDADFADLMHPEAKGETG
jgi:hypothetical protein